MNPYHERSPMSLPRFMTALATALALVLAHTAFAAPGPEAANALQQQQLEDTLELNLQQSTPGTPVNMSPADAQQLNELQLSQHMQQQQLDQQQLMQQQLALQPQRIGPNLNGQGALQQQQRQQQQ